MKTKDYPVGLRNFVKTLLVCIAFWLLPSVAKADTPIPTGIVSSYNPALGRLTLNVNWFWTSQASNKYVGAAVFADLNGDGIIPSVFDNPATYTSGGNPFPAGLQARDEFLGQLAISNIEGNASSTMFPAGDNTDNGVASGVAGMTPTMARMLFPYGPNNQSIVNASGSDNGSFTLTYNGLTVSPAKICVILYDPHSPFTVTGGHSVISAGPNHNEDNSLEEGNTAGTVSCTGLVNLQCAINKTEAGCQSQAAIITSYTAWLNSVTASGCNGVLTNNSTGAPSANGGSKTVTWTYTQNSCPNQAQTTTCSATFTVLSCTNALFNPDFNITYVNVPVPGNVSTNDVVPVGTTYGTSPTPVAGNPAGGVLTMTSTGSYSFVSPNVGVYKYLVPVCIPSQVPPCPNSLLTITVLGPNTNTNPPVANTDIASTMVNTPVTIPSLANDKAGNPGGMLNPASVTITVNPLHGTVTVDPATGNTTYSPALNFTGNDTLTYRVCDNSVPPLCATAIQIITVKASGGQNTTLAADDYATTPMSTPVSGNVKTNDTDPEGNTQTVTAQNVTIAAGTLSLANTGAFTFTPAPGFSGPVSFVYTTCDNGVPVACANATLYILVSPDVSKTNPDFNSTYVNVTVPGNVSTNDKVPGGTTYCTSPTLVSSPAGSVKTLTMNSNGSYTFVANMPGVYTYDVCVCVPGAVAPCPTTPLVITVLNHIVVTNPPVANVDIATTLLNTPVTLMTLANDAAGNSGNSLVPSTVSVTVNPLNGTVTVNPATGNTTYTPNLGWIGADTLTYQVCDNQSPAKCATAKQVITTRPLGLSNITVAADDYKITQINTPATGNVKTNDSDPEGNTQTVTAQPGTTMLGKGTLVLATDGSYTFTPVAGYTGPVDFPYTTCDNGVPVACASATLHVLVRPEAPMTNPDFNSTFVNVHVGGDVRTNDFVPAGTSYGTSPVLTSSPLGSTATLVMGATGVYDFVANMVGVYVYAVPVCVPGQVAPCPTTDLTITVLAPLVNTNSPVANVDIASTMMNQPVILKTLANDAAGSPAFALVPSTVTVTVLPLHGTATANAVNGDITYAPAVGFVGFDTLTYQVCDNQSPSKCATAKQIIWVKGPGMTNTTSAADDYKITLVNTLATGNVKTNDNDAEGNAQTVTAQPSTTVPGKGTLVLAADGSYTFTPVLNFSGPVDFPYTTCDNGVPVACASATLHILVKPAVPVPDLSPTITAIPNIMHGTTNFNVTVDVTELLGNPTNGSQILIRIPKDPRLTFTYNAALVMVGFTPVNNSVWAYDGSDPIFHKFTTNTIIPGNGVSTFGFAATFTPGQSQGKYTLSSSLNSGSGGETITNNNQDAEVLDYFIN